MTDKRVFVYAFAWPPGRAYSKDVDLNRNPVGYYFESMKRSSDALLARFVGSTFVVHMHPRCAHLATYLPNKFKVVYCAPEAHWRFPVLRRSTTTLCHEGPETVIQLDVHDVPEHQIQMVSDTEERMRYQSKSAGLTFWPTDGQPIEAETCWQGSTEQEFKVFAAGDSSRKAWWIDAGTLITTSSFRDGLKIDYDLFLAGALKKYNNLYQDFESISDEGLLDLALFKNRDIARYVKDNSCIGPHWLAAASFDLPLIHDNLPPPEYDAKNISDELPGDTCILTPGQDVTMDAQRIKSSVLKFGSAPTVANTVVVKKDGKKRVVLHKS